MFSSYCSVSAKELSFRVSFFNDFFFGYIETQILVVDQILYWGEVLLLITEMAMF